MKDAGTLHEVREALLARILWGVLNGSAVEAQPGGVVSFAEAVDHVTAHLGAEAARRVVAVAIKASACPVTRL